MYSELLADTGLTENETKVYLALLQHGQSTSSAVVSKSAISGGKVYETLDRLYQKGLVSVSQINGAKHFQATHPQSLINFVDMQKQALEKKEQAIESVLPKLIALQEKVPQHTSVNLLIGFRSIRPLVQDLFSKAQSVCAMGIRGTKKSPYNNFWWHLTSSVLEKRNIEAQYLFVEHDSEYYKKHKSLQHVQVKYLDTISPIALDIIDNNLLLFTYDEHLQCVHIENEAIASSFRSFFATLWKQAKP